MNNNETPKIDRSKDKDQNMLKNDKLDSQLS